MRKKKNWKDEPCYLYIAENKANGDIYVGISKNPKMRIANHKAVSKGGPEKYPRVYSYIHKAINKYGWDNFEFNVADYFGTRAEAKQAEIFWIAELKRLDIKVYNLTEGGDGISGYEYTEEERAAMSERMKGKFAGEANPFFGQNHTEETKQILGASMAERQANGEFRGENHSQSKYNDELVAAIRFDYGKTGVSQKDLEVKYGIPRGAIQAIVSNRSWTHIKTTTYDPKTIKKKKTNDYWDKKTGPKIIFQITCGWCQKVFEMERRERDKRPFPKYCGNECKISALQHTNATSTKPRAKPVKKTPKLPPKLSDEQKEQLVKDASHMTMKMLRTKYGVGVWTVNTILKPYNIRPYIEKSSGCKLDNQQEIDRVRKLYATGKYNYAKLSALFDVAPSTISNIVQRKFAYAKR